jgi:hypothetical protein
MMEIALIKISIVQLQFNKVLTSNTNCINIEIIGNMISKYMLILKTQQRLMFLNRF